MKIALTDWAFSYDAASAALVLTYTGQDAAKWSQNKDLAFSITSVLSSSSPTTGQLQINFKNFKGNVPLQTQTPLSLSQPAKPGNAKLSEVLQIALDSQGTVYVSQQQGDRTDPLQNSLFLNLKNIGDQPIYSGEKMWSGNPRITVTFIYGNTSGALAPDNDKAAPIVGSAWKIAAQIQASQGGAWNVTNPSNTGSCLLYTSPSPRDQRGSRMPSSA